MVPFSRSHPPPLSFSIKPTTPPPSLSPRTPPSPPQAEKKRKYSKRPPSYRRAHIWCRIAQIHTKSASMQYPVQFYLSMFQKTAHLQPGFSAGLGRFCRFFFCRLLSAGYSSFKCRFRILCHPNGDGCYFSFSEIISAAASVMYRHIRKYYLSNSKTFQDGNGNGNFGKINSNDFQDGNWESMEMKGRLRAPRR